MTKKNDLTKMFIHTANIVRKPKKQKPKTYIRSIKIILPSSLLIIVQKNTLLVQKNHNFLLMHSVGSYPHGNEIDVPLIYADYYFLEALKRKRDCDIEAKSKSVQK